MNRCCQRVSSYSFKSHTDRLYFSVFIKVHTIYTSCTAVRCSFSQRTTVINDIPFICSGTFNYRMVTSTGCYISILLQNFSDSFKRTERWIRNGIGYTIIRTSPATFRPHKIIFSIMFQHKRPFHIILGSHFLIDSTILKRYNTQ